MTADRELADRCRAALARAVKLIVRRRTWPRTRTTPAAGGTSRPATTATSASPAGRSWPCRAAKAAGCAVPSENIDRALAYLKRCAARGRRLRLPARRRAEQPPDRHRHPGAGDLRRAPLARGRRRRRVPARATRRAGPARISSTRSTTAPWPCSRWATSTSSPTTPSSSRSCSTTRTRTGAGSPATATTAPAAATTARRWPSWPWRWNIDICQFISDNDTLVRQGFLRS